MRRLMPWAGAAMIIVIIFGTIFGAVQQTLRMDANYPQVQLAEDTATSLLAGNTPASVTQTTVDIDSSLAPFVIVYDRSGNVVSGSGYLGGAVPSVPFGVLSAASGKDYHFVTWQPRADVRIAAVTVDAGRYYVLSGRSLKEVEKNETRIIQLTSLGCVLALAVLTLTFVLSGGLGHLFAVPETMPSKPRATKKK